jgi:DNA-binding MltR family transcriptional regulator
VVALLDSALSELLQDRMVKDDEIVHPMFHEGQPLGAFGSKIRLAYLLGLYSRSVYDNLSIIGKIRNAFAHKSGANDFNNNQISSLVNNLTILKHVEDKELAASGVITKPEGWAKILESFDLSKPRWKFMLSAVMLTGLINTTKTLRKEDGWPVV